MIRMIAITMSSSIKLNPRESLPRSFPVCLPAELCFPSTRINFSGTPQLLERGAREITLQYGIGLVTTPIPEPGTPVLGAAPGLLPAAIYYVQITWVSATGVEGNPSKATVYEAPVASLLTVTNGTGLCGTPVPAIATRFNVYIGPTDATTTLQNSTPIAIGHTFTEAATGLLAGAPAGTGQSPDLYVTGGSVLRRG